MYEHPSQQRKNFKELLDKIREATPFIDDKVAELLRIRPDLFAFETGPNGELLPSYQLGKIAAIILVDWLCWAFDMPDKGFVHPPREDLDAPTDPPDES